MSTLTTRERIVEAADQLFYQHGFEKTSFADISEKVNISRGNFYHHFRTKDDILSAVIEKRLQKTQMMLDQWQLNGVTPKERIQSFIKVLIMNRAKIKKYGCPVGSLCSELAKLNHASQDDANRLFTMFREWLCLQFEQLGYMNEADRLAMHLLARSQGVASLANAFHDEAFIDLEVKNMCAWLESMTTR